MMTFSEPDPIFFVPNPDCPTAADCTAHPAALTRPVFFISPYGFSDSIIASPATERAFFLSTSVHAAAPRSTPRSASSSARTASRPTIPRSRTPQATRAVCSVTPRPGWNTSSAPTRLRPPPSPGRIRSWSRTLTSQAAPPSEPGPAAKVPGLANTGNPANGEVARSRHRTPGSGKPRIAPADSTIPRSDGYCTSVLSRASACRIARVSALSPIAMAAAVALRGRRRRRGLRGGRRIATGPDGHPGARGRPRRTGRAGRWPGLTQLSRSGRLAASLGAARDSRNGGGPWCWAGWSLG